MTALIGVIGTSMVTSPTGSKTGSTAWKIGATGAKTVRTAEKTDGTGVKIGVIGRTDGTSVAPPPGP